jgi:OOP family OmpA-OmpF porin
MTSLPTLRLLALATLGTALAVPASAQDTHYWYGGLGAGISRAEIDQERITAGLLGGGLTTSAFRRDERSTAYKLFGGYQFGPHIAVEAGYFDLGRFDFTATTVPAGALDGRIKLQGLNLDLVGTLPLSERWSVIGRIGAQAAQARDHFSGSGSVSVLDANPSKREINPKLGIGLQYAFSPSMQVRAEAERYRINDAVGNHGGVNVVSVSLVFPFGRADTLVARAPMAPAYVAPAPAPAPAPVVAEAPPPVVVVPAPVAAAPERRRVSFSAESLFGFDQSAIKPEGKAALDRFAAEAQTTQFDVIIVEGHTDRLGSTAYNQRLSTQRADAVKAYLVSAGGVDASRINAIGRGESTPVTPAGLCKGERPTAALIACLQPDRRVELEVTGSR